MLTPLFSSIQKFVLRTYRINPFCKLYRTIYWLALRILIRQLRTLSQIEKVYLRRGLSTNAWIPGASDIDLFILYSETDSQKEIDFLKRFWQKYFSLKKWFPFFGEVQIATQTEFKNYASWGDIRAWEAEKTWRPLYPQKNNTKLARNLYQYSPLKFKLDALTEMLNAYLLFANVYFGKKTIVSSINYSKTFADILKYGFYITYGVREDVSQLSLRAIAKQSHETLSDEKEIATVSFGDLAMTEKGCYDTTPQDLPFNRTTFLSFFSEQTENPELKRIINKLSNRTKPATFSADFLLEVYVHTLKYMDGVCKLLFEELRKGLSPVFFQEIECKPSTEQYEKKREEARKLFQQISNKTEGTVQRIILPVYPYLPSCMYVIINDISKVERVIRVLRYRTLTDLYGIIPLVLTNDMFNCLIHSLHLETPFNYYSLNNEWASSPEEKLKRPDDLILLLLLKECIANLSISFRMYEHGLPGSSNIYAIYYLLNRILRLHLAWGKKIIVPAPLDDFLKVYAYYYPQSKEWSESMEKIISLPAEEIERMNIGEFYYTNYPFFSKILREINREICLTENS